MEKGLIKRRLELLLLCLALLFSISCTVNSTDADAASKTTLSVKKETIFINSTYQIPLKNKIKKATYFYTSNKTKVARVNSKGIITGIGKGTAAIKVRYKYKGEFHPVGTFKITIKKSTLKSTHKILNMLTGDSVKPDEYLNNPNPDATYIITSSLSAIAGAGNDGIINAKKAGRTSIGIHEVVNKRSRTIGSIALSVTGASIKRDEVRMAYNSRMYFSDLLEDMSSTSSYTMTSNDTNLVYTSRTNISAVSKGTGNKSCEITVEEKMSNKVTHTIGKFTVNVTDEPFITYNNQNVSIGLNEEITVGTSSTGKGIIIANKVSGAKYELISSNTSVAANKVEVVNNNKKTIVDKLVGTNYGTATITIKQTKNDVTTTLTDTVTLTVDPAFIKQDIKINGISVTVGGDTYNEYPVDCRNTKATYSYESADTTICGVGTAGLNKDQDYLVATGKKSGITEITVYETLNGKRNKIGSFKVTVTDNSSSNNNNDNNNNNNNNSSNTPTLMNPVASTLISSITLNHHKSYKGTVSNTSLECIFGDDSGNYIDYGTDFNSISRGEFDIKLTNSQYQVKSIYTDDGYEWTAEIELNDSEDTIVEVPILLISEELDVSSIISSIDIRFGTNDNITSITKDTKFPDDNTISQFEDSNHNFFVNYTAKQYSDIGVTEFDTTVTNPTYLSELKKDVIKCSVNQNVFGVNNISANSAVKTVSTPVSNDNSFWTFEVTFEDGTVEEFDITLGLSE